MFLEKQTNIKNAAKYIVESRMLNNNQHVVTITNI